MSIEKTPKDKMIRKSPKTKGTVEVEVVATEEKELNETEKKELQVIGEKIVTTQGDAYKKLTRNQIDLIKRTVAKGADDDELKFFLSVCQGAQLNPFLRQVHFVKRWSNKDGREIGTIQVGIDGFRAIAESSGNYAGSDDAVHRDEREIEYGKEKKKVTVPGSATVTVYKLMPNGERYPFTATARWSEYYPGATNGYMWHKMPYGQLGKCAEALALRKAFPKLLSGLYAPEEMDQAGGRSETPVASAYTKALSMIAKTTDPKGLEDYKAKVGGSEKYDDSQKKTIIEAVDKRLAELKKDAPTEATP